MLRAACLISLALLLLTSSETRLRADVTLAPLFRDHAVLQRDKPIPIWGHATAGEHVRIRFGETTAHTRAADDGRWIVRLPSRPASDRPEELVVTGDNRIVVRDVLVGDVWLCGGQSNMMMVVRNARDPDREIATANLPRLRLFRVAPQFTDRPVHTVGGDWQPASPETVGSFSATAYYFGRELHPAIDVPVGLIVSAYGNTPISTWRSPEALADDAVVADWWQAQQRKTPAPRPHRQPSAGHNGMIAPLVPYAVRGFLWYQGEADATETPLLTPHYATQFSGLIREWRHLFGEGGSLPFFWVQLAGYGQAAPRDWTGLRAQQALALHVPSTGQVVALDLGDSTDIHPKNKQEVGARLARLALRGVYGRDITDTGPLPVQVEAFGRTMTICFDSDPLIARGDLTTTFELAGADGVFHPATDVQIEGNTINVSSETVASPQRVRFGWQDLPGAFLYNSDHLPAAPFERVLPLPKGR